MDKSDQQHEIETAEEHQEARERGGQVNGHRPRGRRREEREDEMEDVLFGSIRNNSNVHRHTG